MKAFAYCRVSTDQQELSPEVQRSQMAAYCAMKGYEIIPMDDEIGVSGGTPFAERPIGSQIIARIAEVDAVLFSKLDRAFRDVIDCLQTVELFAKLGKTVVFLDLGVDTSTPAGMLCLTMMAAFAAFERRRTAERIRESLAQAKKQGKKIGPAPFGSRNIAHMEGDRKVNGGLHESVEREGLIISRIMFCRHQGWSYREIATDLIERGVPSRRGGTWAPQTVRAIVRRAQ